jgi:hypothetical protein
MSHRGVEIVLGRLATDEATRRMFGESPGRTLRDLMDSGIELSPVELAALEALDGAAIQRFAQALDSRLRRAVFGTLAVLAALLSLAGGVAVAQAPKRSAQAFLRNVIGLDPAALAAVDRGEIVTRVLPTTDRSEVAAFGVVRTAGSSDLVLRLARDVRTFRKAPQVQSIGLFSAPAKVSDLDGLVHPPDDIAALRKCKPGTCDVKLGTRGLELFAGIDWSSPDAHRRAAALFNEGIVEYVGAYQRGGDDALGDILDKKDARSRAQEYRKLLASSPYLYEYVREISESLESYPGKKLAGAEDVFYWTKDAFGPKPVISAHHLMLYRGPRGALVVDRMLGSTHFFNAALDVMAAVPAPDGKGLYLLSLYRTRLDPPTGMLAGALLGKVKEGIEKGVRENLVAARARLAAGR